MKRYGLIGYPVKKSLSPAMHNAGFKDLGIDAEYKLFEVEPSNLKEFFAHFKERLCGVNVTIPHKEAACKYVDLLDNRAKSIGAVNTITIENDKLIGYNTDIIGFTRSLKEDLEFNAQSKKAIVFGAGGASRAVCFGLVEEGIGRLILVDIDSKRAVALAGDLEKAGIDVMAVEYDEKVLGDLVLNSDLLVNATPCGMKDGDREIISTDFLHKRLRVFDLVYLRGGQTPLIKAAKTKGLKCTSGIGMLLYQGVAAFELWTGKNAPLKIMKEAME